MNNKTIRLQRGQSLIIIALLMVAMLAFLGLVIDGGTAFVTRRGTQNASDAAAFAGVRILAGSDKSSATERSIWNNILTFAQSNGVVSQDDITPYFVDSTGTNIRTINKSNSNDSIPSNATGVRVYSSITFQPLFITVLSGGGQDTTTAHATVQSGPASFASLLAPVAITSTTPFTYNQNYSLNIDTGKLQWIDWYYGTSKFNTCPAGKDVDCFLSLYFPGGAASADPADTCTPTNTSPCSLNPSPWIPSLNNGTSYDNNFECVVNAWITPSLWGVSRPSGTNVNNCANLDGLWGTKPITPTWIVPVFDVYYPPTGNPEWFHTISFAEFQITGYIFQTNNNNCNSCYWNGYDPSYQYKQGNLGNMPAPLQSCFGVGKCVMGKFLRAVAGLPGIPGACNTNGLNLCAIGLTE